MQLIDVNLLVRGVFNMLGDLDKSLVHGRDALLVAEALGDLRRVVQSCIWLATSLCHAGRGVEALTLGHRARAAAKTLDDQHINITVNMVLGFASWILGHYRDAKAYFDANLESIPDRIEVAAPRSFWTACVNSRCWLVLALVERGDFNRAERVAREAFEQATALNRVYPLAHFVSPWVCVVRGNAARGIQDLERGLALCRSVSYQATMVPFVAALGRAYCLAGRAADAVGLLEEGIASAEAHNRANRGLWLSFLSEAYLSAGWPRNSACAPSSPLPPQPRQALPPADKREQARGTSPRRRRCTARWG